MNYSANILFCFGARNHYLVTALFTFDFEVHAGTQNSKTITAAGMIFFHNKLVADSDIHVIAPFQHLFHYIIARFISKV